MSVYIPLSAAYNSMHPLNVVECLPMQSKTKSCFQIENAASNNIYSLEQALTSLSFFVGMQVNYVASRGSMHPPQ